MAHGPFMAGGRKRPAPRWAALRKAGAMPADDPDPASELRADTVETPLRRLLALAGAGPGQAIDVAGEGGLEVLVALCRLGCERVECARQATCPGADELGDLLILTGPSERLGAVAAGAARLVRDGGIVAARLARIEDDAPIRAALAARGLEVAGSAVDIAAGGLIVAHRVRRPARLAQAI